MKKITSLVIVLGFIALNLAAQQNPAPDGFVRINGGTFTMGSPANEQGLSWERPQHEVTVSPFIMGKYTVTQKEWEEIMGTGVFEKSVMAGIIMSSVTNGEGDDYPMYYVTWYEAIEYCNKRSEKEGLTPVYRINGTDVTWDRNANGYRLPTEAEWEYACRAGTTTPYNSGTSVDSAGWHRGNCRRTQTVGKKQPNSWGLYDMHGNVWEWCWDWRGNYSNEAQINPVGSDSDGRAVRGGSWDVDARYIRSAYRLRANPSHQDYNIGFRLVRSMVTQR